MPKTRLLRQAISKHRADKLKHIYALLIANSGSSDDLKPVGEAIKRGKQFDDKIDAVRERWQAFRIRSEIYANNEYYKKYNLRWLLSRTIDTNLRRIEQSLLALDELHELAHNNELGKLNYHDAEETLLNIIDFSIRRIELKQSLLLLKYQGIARDRNSLIDLARSIRTMNKQIRSKINKFHYFDLDLPEHMHNVFKKFKIKKLRFDNVSKKLDIVSDTRRAAVSTYTTFSTIQTQYPYLINIAQTTSSVLSSIPILSSIGSIIPPLITTIKNWYQRRSNTRVAISLLMLGLAIGGAIVSGVVATAIAAAAVAAALVAAGIIYEHVVPYIQLIKKINHFQDERHAIFLKIREIDKIFIPSHVQKNPFDLSKMALLDTRDKHALIRMLEDYYTRHPDEYNPNDLIYTQGQINRGYPQDLTTNQFFMNALEGKKISNFNKNYDSTYGLKLLHFLRNAANDREQYLNDEIKALNKQRRINLASMVNACVSLTGAIMLCIPFPPVIIVGAVLIALSTLVAIGIKYRWHEKIANLFTRKQPQNGATIGAGVSPTSQLKSDLTAEKSERHTASVEKSVKKELYSSSSKSSSTPPSPKQVSTPTASSSTSATSERKKTTPSLRSTTSTIFTPQPTPDGPSSKSDSSEHIEEAAAKPTKSPSNSSSSKKE